MNTQRKSSANLLSRCLVLILVASLALAPVSSVSAASTKTVTKSFKVVQTTGVFKVLNYYGKDEFKVTYNPSTKKIVQVKTGKAIKNPPGFDIIERGTVTKKKLSASKWQYKTTWYLNFKSVPEVLKTLAEKKVPVLEAICSIGRFVAFRATYIVTGEGKVTQKKTEYKYMVPSNLKGAALTLLKSFMK